MQVLEEDPTASKRFAADAIARLFTSTVSLQRVKDSLRTDNQLQVH